ncbi:MAG: hypothetical protein LBH59_03040 [Planctomycetaceae bacterium]|nr:hypothetical protein [Planctomycetaceae bacterium]
MAKNNQNIPKTVWAVGIALEQTLHVVALTVFRYVDFKVDSAYNSKTPKIQIASNQTKPIKRREKLYTKTKSLQQPPKNR